MPSFHSEFENARAQAARCPIDSDVLRADLNAHRQN